MLPGGWGGGRREPGLLSLLLSSQRPGSTASAVQACERGGCSALPPARAAGGLLGPGALSVPDLFPRDELEEGAGEPGPSPPSGERAPGLG